MNTRGEWKDILCPKCGAWIGTFLYRIKDGKREILHLCTSSDFVWIDEPCKNCSEEE